MIILNGSFDVEWWGVGGLKFFVSTGGYMKVFRRVDLKNCVP